MYVIFFFSLPSLFIFFSVPTKAIFSDSIGASCSIDPFKPDFYEVVSRRTGFHTSGFATSPSRGKSGCENVSVRVVRLDLRDPGSPRSWRTAIVRAFERRPIMRAPASSESNYYFHERARVARGNRRAKDVHLRSFHHFHRVPILALYFFCSFIYFFFLLRLRNFYVIMVLSRRGGEENRWREF